MTVEGDHATRKVLMVGDTHANYRFWKQHVIPIAMTAGAHVIVQLGDFGYWPRIGEGRSYLKYLSALLVKRNLQVVFIDGNHEDHLELARLAPRSDGFVEVAESILWAPRGHRWEWDGIRFLALGGAFSVDRRYRKRDSAQYGWFEEELITDAQVERAIEGGPCDVLLAHDAPSSTVGFLLKRINALSGDQYPDSDKNAERVQRVADATNPKQLWHGHWHDFLDIDGVTTGPPFTPPTGSMRVISLACDDTPDSFSLLELPKLQVTHSQELSLDTGLDSPTGMSR